MLWEEQEAHGKGSLPGGRICREGSGCSTAKLIQKQALVREGGSGYSVLCLAGSSDVQAPKWAPFLPSCACPLLRLPVPRGES